jgi:hypothetical protein
VAFVSGERFPMLANTIVLPLPSGNITLTRINQDGYASEYYYRTATDGYTLKVRNTRVNPTTGRSEVYERHNVEFTHVKFAAGAVPQYDRKVYFVTEAKPGDTAVDEADGLFDYAVATSDAFLKSLEAWES